MLVLAVLAAWVLGANALPQPGMVAVGVSPAVTFQGSPATVDITFRGVPQQAQTATVPVDMVLLVDVSGSVQAWQADLAAAAQTVAADIARARPDTRFALIAFDSNAATLADWTNEPQGLGDGFGRIATMTGATDPRRAFEELDSLLSRARPSAQRSIVFFTDGVLDSCGGCPQPMSRPEMVEQAERLRRGGLAIYSVGVPGYPSDPLMREITGASARVFDPTSLGDLTASFRSVANEIVGLAGRGATLTHRIDGRSFDAPIAGTAWSLDPTGNLVRRVGVLPKAEVSYRHPVVPLHAGLWTIDVEPPAFVFAGDNGQVVDAAAERRPLMLVLSWLLLLLGLLPALAWVLAYLLLRRAPETGRAEPVGSPAPLIPPHVTTRLPVVPTLPPERPDPVPTLFVGLGGAGRAAVHAVRGDLKEAHCGARGAPYQFDCWDVDAAEPGRKLPFDDWPELPLTEHVAPESVRRAQRYLPDPAADVADERLAWFQQPCSPRRRAVPAQPQLRLARRSCLGPVGLVPMARSSGGRLARR